MLKGRQEVETKVGEAADDITDIMKAGMEFVKAEEELKELMTGKEMEAKMTKTKAKMRSSLNLAARQVSIVVPHPHTQSNAKETNMFDEIDPVRRCRHVVANPTTAAVTAPYRHHRKRKLAACLMLKRW